MLLFLSYFISVLSAFIPRGIAETNHIEDANKWSIMESLEKRVVIVLYPSLHPRILLVFASNFLYPLFASKNQNYFCCLLQSLLMKVKSTPWLNKDRSECLSVGWVGGGGTGAAATNQIGVTSILPWKESVSRQKFSLGQRQCLKHTPLIIGVHLLSQMSTIIV